MKRPRHRATGVGRALATTGRDLTLPTSGSTAGSAIDKRPSCVRLAGPAL